MSPLVADLFLSFVVFASLVGAGVCSFSAAAVNPAGKQRGVRRA
jgi:hypothetical protein